MNWSDRIAIEPGKRGGQPVIRGLRITVYDVLHWLADGMTVNEIIEGHAKTPGSGRILTQRRKDAKKNRNDHAKLAKEDQDDDGAVPITCLAGRTGHSPRPKRFLRAASQWSGSAMA